MFSVALLYTSALNILEYKSLHIYVTVLVESVLISRTVRSGAQL